MPTVMKDKLTLKMAVDGCLAHVKDIRYIYIICSNENTMNFNNNRIKFIDEATYPFTVADIEKFYGENGGRNGGRREFLFS